MATKQIRCAHPGCENTIVCFSSLPQLQKEEAEGIGWALEPDGYKCRRHKGKGEDRKLERG